MNTHSKRRSTKFAIALATLGMVSAACGSDDTADPAAPAPDEESAPADDTAESATTEAATATTEADGAPADRSGGELVVALTTQPNAIDGVNSAERNAANVATQIFDGLVLVTNQGTYEPALATSWSVSDDGLVYTVELRDDVTFHNGEPFNAEAMVFSWEVQQDPANQYANIWSAATDVRAIDEFTIEIEVPEPNAQFLSQLANWYAFPPEYYAEVGQQEFSQAPIGTGAFMLTEWAQGDRIVLDRNPDYWRDGLPHLDRVTFRPITESSTRVAAIQTGEVDIVTRLSAVEAESLQGNDGIDVLEYPTNRVFYTTFNNLTSGVGEPTEDPLVRQALNYAVDVEGIIAALFDGKAKPATGLVVEADFGYDSSIEPYGYDPDRANELLAEAGYADGFSMNMACPSGAYTNFEQVCEAIVAQLGEVGVDVSLDLIESGAFWDLQAEKDLPPLFGDSWSNTSPEAFDRLFGALGGEEASFSAWSDPTIDQLMSDIRTTTDDDDRAALYVELQQYMQEDPPFIYLYEPFSFEATSSDVSGYEPLASEVYYLWNVEV